MGLKDWKQLESINGKYRWCKELNDEWHDKKIVTINKDNQVIVTFTQVPKRQTPIKKFKTKEQAMVYAKKYMQNCRTPVQQIENKLKRMAGF